MPDTDEKSPSTDYLGLKKVEPALPAAWYYDPAQYDVELTAVWQKSWLYVCHASALSEPLSYRTLEIGDQNIVVLRASDGDLRAFHNACRHRGSILCKEREGKLASRLMVCPYHQWSYAVEDGRLVRTTSFTEPAGFDKTDYPLFSVAVGEWRGCIFINLDADAEWSPESAFNRTPENLANYPMEDMVVGHTWRTIMECNWKTFWENFSECLHCPEIHPELGALVPMFTRRITNFKNQPGWQDHVGSGDPKFEGGLGKGVETWSMDGKAQGHVIENLSDEDLARGYTYGTSLPSVFIGGYPDHIRIVRLLPISPEQTELVSEWLFTPETLNAPDYDIKNVVEFAILVMQQDMDACDLNQRGLHAAPLKQGVLMPEEHYVKDFQDWVRARLGSETA
jgi:glycine betaine catabolism A